MSAAELVALVCCDLGSIVRGRSVLEDELGEHLVRGIGWVPANHAITPLGRVADPNPFGSTGDLRLLPDPSTRTLLAGEEGALTGAAQDGQGALDVMLCDIVELDGRPWECCPREFLRGALRELEQELGASVRASFEHEFVLSAGQGANVGSGAAGGPGARGAPGPEEPALAFTLEAQRAVEPFPRLLMGALVQAGLEPERFFAEYARHQFEVPLAPAQGIASADRSVLLRVITQELARRLGMRASFVPLAQTEEAGSGMHIHVSLTDSDRKPLLYDAARPARLSELGGRFAAGVLAHARALSALSAASPVSAARLRPHRWSAGAVCLAEQNREALVRIPPVLALAGEEAPQLHLEYRGADASANPHLALGALLRAGLHGIREQLPVPELLECDPSELDAAAAERFGVGALPASLDVALEALAEDEVVRGWFSPLLYDAYVAVKRAELEAASDVELEELCRRYAAIY